jgi:Transcriptional regulator
MSTPTSVNQQRPTRRVRRKAARPQEIVDAALQVFVAKGFAAARVDEIAQRAGVAKRLSSFISKAKTPSLSVVRRRSSTS